MNSMSGYVICSDVNLLRGFVKSMDFHIQQQ